MATTAGASKVIVLVALWHLTLWGQCSASNFSEYESGSGALDMDSMRPLAVQNLNISYNDTNNALSLVWMDPLNINDTNLGYRIVYTFNARGLQLATNTVSLLDVDNSSTSFENEILAGGFSEAGVTVSVDVQACNDFGLGEPAQVSLMFTGDFSPPPANFSVMANTDNTSLTLFWDNAFDAVPPTDFIITYSASKLSGSPLNPNDTTVTVMVARTSLSSSMDSDYMHVLSNLLFYTRYNVSLVAVYDGNQSMSVSDQAVTLIGVPGPVQSLVFSFNSSLLTFDPAMRDLNASISISWDEPLEPNGNSITYTYSLLNATGAVILEPLMSSMTTVETTVLVLPYEFYRVEVSAVSTLGDAGEGVMSSLERSPEAAPSATSMISANSITVTNATITWTEPEFPNGLITNYLITLINDGIASSSERMTNSNGTSFEVLGLAPNTLYSVSVRGVTGGGVGTSGNSFNFTTSEGIPTEVRQLSLTVNGSHLIVMWEAPMELNGVVNYNVTVSGINLVNNEQLVITPSSEIVSDTEYIIPHNSVPYSNYTAEVFAQTSAGSSPTEMITVQTPEEAPSEVQQLNLTVNDTHLIVTWTPPLEPNGVVNYNVTVTGTNLVNNEAVLNQTSAVISDTVYIVPHNSVPYSNYTAEVFAQTSAGSSPTEMITVQTPEEVPTEVRQLNLTVNGSHLIVMWTLPMEPNGVVIYNVTLSGINLVNNEQLVISPSSEIVSDTEYIVPHNSVPYSNYTAEVFAQTSAGSSPTEMITVQTPEEVPTEVQQLSLTVNDTHLIVSWVAPSEPNGVVSYNVTVTGINLVNNEDVLNQTSAVISDTEYIIPHNSVPYSNYTAEVFAQTSAGSSPTEMITVQTPEEVPTEVQQLSLTVNDTHLIVSWVAPSEPNGVVSYNVTVTGINLVNNEAVLNQTSAVISDTEYIIPHNSVPYSNYTAEVFAQTSAGSSPTIVDTVVTSEEVPTEVRQLSLTVNGSHLIVMWTPPSEPNGVVNYSVTLSGINLVNNKQLVITPSSEIVSDTEYIIPHNSVPYSNYTAEVYAQTSAGSSPTEMITVQTPEEVPTGVRQLNFAVNGSHLIVMWDAPSEPNGVVNYSVTLSGINLVNNEVVLNQTSAVISDTEYIIPHNSVPYSNYTAEVFAQTSAGSSPSEMITVQTPEEVPSMVENLITNFTVDVPSSYNMTSGLYEGSLQISWEEPLFPNGVITDYIYKIQGPSPMAVSIVDDSTDSTTVQIDIGLLPNEMYTVIVTASTVAGPGMSSMGVVTVPEAIPSEVRALTITITNSSTLTISWDPPLMPNGVLTYNITLSFTDLATAFTDVVLFMQLDETNRMVEYTHSSGADLEPYAKYDVSVIASTSVGASAAVTESVVTDQGVSEAPRNLTVDPSNTTVSVTWAPPNDTNGIIDSYLVVLLDSTSDMVANQTVENSTLSVEFDELIPFSNYTVSVRAFTDDGAMEGMSVMDTFMTETGIPTRPQSVTVTVVSSDSLDVMWGAPVMLNAPSVIYNVQYRRMADTVTVVSDITETSRLIDSLEASVTYFVSVQACSLVGCSEFTNEVEMTTGEAVPSEVRALTITITNSSTLTITWNPPLMPNGVLTYNITLSFTDLATAFTDVVLFMQLDETNRMVEYTHSSGADLEPYAKYDVSVIASTSVGASAAVTESVVTDQGVSEAPRNLTVEPSNTTVSVTWAPPNDTNGVIDSYLVVLLDSNSDMVANETVENSTLSVEFDELIPFSNYTVSVRALTDDGAMEGMSVMDTFMTETGRPSAPTLTLVNATSSSSVRLEWTEPSITNGVIVNYIITYYITSDGLSSTQSNSTLESGTSFVLTGLNVFTNYSVYVQANTTLVGPPSETVTVVTNEDVPGLPQTVVAVELNSTSVNVSWSIPTITNGNIVSYIIYYATDNNGDFSDERMTIINEASESMLFVVLENLIEFTSYRIEVSASTSIGEGGRSSPVSVTTDPDSASPPTFVDVTVINSTAIQITWGYPMIPRGLIQGYKIEYGVASEPTLMLDPDAVLVVFNHTLEIMNDTTDQSVTIDSLLPVTYYVFRVAAFSFSDPGDPFQLHIGTFSPGTTAVKTNEDVPSAPLTFALQEVAENSTRLSAMWLIPEPTNGIITTYTVSCVMLATETGTPMEEEFQVFASTNGDTDVMIDGLTAFTFYQCLVTANTSVGEGPVSNNVTQRTAQDVPNAPPQNVIGTPLTSTSINVTWEAPPTESQRGFLTNYTISYVIIGNGDAPVVRQVEPGMLSLELVALEKFIEYSITLRASTIVGPGPGETIAVQTLSDIPSEPLNLSYTNETSMSITLSWQPPASRNGIIDTYTLQVTNTNSLTAVITTDISGNMTEFLVVGLLPFTNYELVLYALTDRGAGPGSVSLIVYTLEDLPTVPQNFTLSPSTSTQLTATWSPPDPQNGMITSYTIYCSTSNDQAYPEITSNAPLDPITVNGDASMQLISMLTPYTSYDCHVTANTSIGEGVASEIQSERTNESVPSDPPQSFIAVTTEATSITLSWSRPTTPNGAIAEYTLSYSNDTFENTEMIMTMTEFEVLGLNEFTNYSFTVSASTSVGPGPLAVLNVTTAEAAPSASPQSLEITFIDSTSLRVNWQPPPQQDQNGQLMNYQISYNVENRAEIFTVATPGLFTVLNDLSIFTVYEVTVAASTVAGIGPPAMASGRTASTRPAAPQNVVIPIANITPTTIFVSWEAPFPVYGDVTMYAIEYTNNGTLQVMSDIDGTSATLTELFEYTNYSVVVFAFTDIGRGNGSEPIVRRTSEHSPEEPTMFRAETQSSTSILLTWRPPRDPNGVIISYHLNATIDTQDSYIVSTGLEDLNPTLGDGSLRMYELTGLHPYVLYRFQLSASTSAGEGTVTQPKTAITQQAVPAQGVSGVTASTVNSTTVSLSWLPPSTDSWNGPITSYTIEYAPVINCQQRGNLSYTTPGMSILTSFANPSNPREDIDALTRESLQITGLEEFVSYTFTVTVATMVGGSMSADVGCALTEAAAPAVAPTITSFTITSNTSAIIDWTELPLIEHNGIISNYTIAMTSGRNESRVMSSVDTSLELTDLIPYTNYTVEVSAVNQAGEGPYSQSVTNRTFEGTPDSPRNLQLSVETPTSIRIMWEAPLEFFGVPSRYYITYRGSKEGSTIPMTVDVASDVTTYLLEGLFGDNTYSISVQASTGAGIGSEISDTVILPKGASPVIEVTEETIDIVPVPAVDDSGKPIQPSVNSFRVGFTILPEQQVNGPVDKVWIFVQRQPSDNKIIGTYYDSSIATMNWRKYPCLEINASTPTTTGGRKKRAIESMPVNAAVGGNENCRPDDTVCNGPLVPNTDYSVGYRLFSGDQSTDYEFQNATYRTAQPESSLAPIVGAVVGVLLVIIIIVVILILILVFVRRSKSGKLDIATNQKNGGQKLLPRDTGNGSNVPFLGPSDPNIVPMGEMILAGGGAGSGTIQKYPMPQKSNSRKIYLRNFNTYLQDMLDDSGYKFSEEYERVTEIGLDHAKEASLMAENRAKNRYTNILAYDHSRVKLSFVDDEPGSDYINACYIPGYRMRRAYIATQGPLPATFDDFWRMVWEQNSHVIVMLTQLVERGRTKCHRYWPGTDPSVYGDIAVELISEHEKEDWTVREFKLSTADRRSRLVRHFQFTSWPDHGVPDTPIAAIDFVKTVRTFVAVNHGPITAHCSAGVGRTGCFIALDTLLQQLSDHDWIDVFGLASEMRQHRNHMIQTEAQYVFIHKAIQDIIETDSMYKPGGNGGFSQSGGFSQPGAYSSLYVNQFTDDSTQMTDYYEDFLSEETHM